MEKVLYARAIRRLPARGGAYRGGLGKAGGCPGHRGTRHFDRLAHVIACACVAAIMMQSAKAQSIKRGEELVTRNCAACHSVGRTGDSPHKSAPPFRVLGQRYPIEALEEALGEGIMTGHPDMPELRFDAGDVGAIIAYLKSIQQR
ncbi:MAG TPA: cytochrome c [Pseudolabrys sp.]|nr:cytochrome c [Pseudolabrys sp.]